MLLPYGKASHLAAQCQGLGDGIRLIRFANFRATAQAIAKRLRSVQVPANAWQFKGCQICQQKKNLIAGHLIHLLSESRRRCPDALAGETFHWAHNVRSQCTAVGVQQLNALFKTPF